MKRIISLFIMSIGLLMSISVSCTSDNNSWLYGFWSGSQSFEYYDKCVGAIINQNKIIISCDYDETYNEVLENGTEYKYHISDDGILVVHNYDGDESENWFRVDVKYKRLYDIRYDDILELKKISE